MFTCTIDFSKCHDYDELYKLIYQALEVPDWCGHNLDALWDVLTGFIDQTDITLKGLDSLSSQLKAEVTAMLPIFARAQRYGITYKIEK